MTRPSGISSRPDRDLDSGSTAVRDAARPRCSWPAADPLMLRYHDEEWGVPVHDDRRHFEFLVLEGAQAGLSWRTILHKRNNYRKAFAGFNPVRVARFDARRINALMRDAGIVRNRLKIESAVSNARAFLAVQREFGSFDDYIWQFVRGRPIVNRWRVLSELPARTVESDALSADLKRRGFRFVGSTVIYAHMQATGLVNDHVIDCYRHRELAGKKRFTEPGDSEGVPGGRRSTLPRTPCRAVRGAHRRTGIRNRQA